MMTLRNGKFFKDGNVCGLSLQCVCGSEIKIEWTRDTEDGVVGQEVQCPGCSFKYEVMDDEFDFKFFKIKEAKSRRK